MLSLALQVFGVTVIEERMGMWLQLSQRKKDDEIQAGEHFPP